MHYGLVFLQDNITVAFDAPPPQKNIHQTITIQGPMRCEGMLNCKVWTQHEHLLLWSRSLCVSRSFRFVSVRVKSRSVDSRIPGQDAGWVLTKPRSCRSSYSTCLNRLFLQVLVPVSVTWEINAFFSNHVRILLGVLDLWLHTSSTGTADLHFALIYRLISWQNNSLKWKVAAYLQRRQSWKQVKVINMTTWNWTISPLFY